MPHFAIDKEYLIFEDDKNYTFFKFSVIKSDPVWTFGFKLHAVCVDWTLEVYIFTVGVTFVNWMLEKTEVVADTYIEEKGLNGFAIKQQCRIWSSENRADSNIWSTPRIGTWSYINHNIYKWYHLGTTVFFFYMLMTVNCLNLSMTSVSF